jgi:hypothetical protein
MAQDKIAENGLKPLKETVERIKALMGQHQPVQPGPPNRLQISTAANQASASAISETMALLVKLGTKGLADISVAVSNRSPLAVQC